MVEELAEASPLCPLPDAWSRQQFEQMPSEGLGFVTTDFMALCSFWPHHTDNQLVT